MRDASSSKIKQINIDPPILNRTFNSSPPRWQIGEFYPNGTASIQHLHFAFPAVSQDTPNRFRRATSEIWWQRI
jgi:hypothetical protein